MWGTERRKLFFGRSVVRLIASRHMVIDRDEPTRLFKLISTAATGTDRQFTASAFVRAVHALEQSAGPCVRAHTLQLLLGRLVRENREKIENLPYPESVQTLVRDEFYRIEKECLEGAGDLWDLRTHQRRCDFRIACFGRIPVGPEHLEIDGLPRSLIYCGGMVQAARFLQTVLTTGGHRPFFVLHLAYGIEPAAFTFVYNKLAQETMFHRVAECLRMNHHIKGVMSAGWLLDPKLADVSPHLSYLREGCMASGAALFRFVNDPEVEQMATANSPHRRRLHEAGKYVPETYMVVWPRTSLIEWSNGKRPATDYGSD